MPGETKKTAREHLWARNPHCYWCGRLTVLEDCPDGGDHRQHAATVDHILSRLEATNWGEYNDRRNKVLSCLKCNRERGVATLARLGPRPPGSISEQELLREAEVQSDDGIPASAPIREFPVPLLLRTRLTADVMADFTL